MKVKLKQLMLNLGIYYPLLNLRSLPLVAKWIIAGYPSPAPQTVKMRVVRAYLKQYRLNQFIETGTFLGETLEYIARMKLKCISVELSSELYSLAKRRLQRYDNVHLINGDSGRIIPEILESLNEPALFWLDSHYSGDGTARGEANTPISVELQAILDHHVRDHVILIEDACHFDGTNDYPHLDDLLSSVRLNGHYRAAVSTDIIRLVPVIEK